MRKRMDWKAKEADFLKKMEKDIAKLQDKMDLDSKRHIIKIVNGKRKKVLEKYGKMHERVEYLWVRWTDKIIKTEEALRILGMGREVSD